MPNVFHISVDGLRSGDATKNLQTLIDAGLAPAFARLQQGGAWTFDARTDPVHTNTLPNHSTMITGRPVEDASGARGHRYRYNDDAEDIPDLPLPGVNVSTLHTSAGEYVPSVFNVVHDNGLSTALYASKSKFSLFDQSYDGVDQPTDPVFENDPLAQDRVGPDNGRDKIDRTAILGDTDALVSRIIADATAVGLADYSFVHLADPDSAGHAEGWGGEAYLAAIVEADRQIGRLLDLIEADPVLRATTFVIVSADHGGGGDVVTDTNHATPAAPLNFTIPFFVLGPDVPDNADLYALNTLRRAEPDAVFNPSILLTSSTGGQPPIRNGDGGNLALNLLGLEAIATSAINARHDLNVFAVQSRFGDGAANALTGGSTADGLEGSGGDDVLQGLAGDDVLDGDTGRDVLAGGTGNDRLNGGADRDRASYADATTAVRVDLRIDGAQDTGGGGRDTLVAVEDLDGSAFADMLTGNDGANALRGLAGNDRLSGGAGGDLLEGGAGSDMMTGGAGGDLFLFAGAGLGADKIGDFSLDDLLVTTRQITDNNGDRRITFGSDRDLDLAGGGSVVITSEHGARLTSLEYDGSFTQDSVSYYVYSRVGSAAGVLDADVLI